MVKKLVIIIITVTLFISIYIAGYVSNADTKGGLKSKGLAYTMPNNNGSSEFSYSFQLTNTNSKTVFVKTIEPIVNETLKKNILSKDTVVAVNKNIEPNETIQISGIIVVDTKGLFMYDVGKFIKDIRVLTEETVSIK
jgi:PKD repeat protein